MAYLCTLLLLILPLSSLYFQFAVSANSAGVPLGGNCTTNDNCTAISRNSECKGTKCQCKVAFYAQNKTCVDKVHIGGRCTNTTNCTSNAANTACKNGTCQCMADYFHQKNNCIQKIALGVHCNATIQCKDGNAECMGTCNCMDAFYKDTNDSCSPRIPPNKTCAKNDSCVDNSYCNKNTICVCKIGYTATPTSCNSAVTMAVVEISTLIICFMLAYLEILK